MAKEKYKPHMMYDSKKAETHKEHLSLKNKGYGHSPNKMRTSPLPGLVSPLKAKAKGMDGKACWKGYRLAGTKKKGGRTVDNCVKM